MSHFPLLLLSFRLYLRFIVHIKSPLVYILFPFSSAVSLSSSLTLKDFSLSLCAFFLSTCFRIKAKEFKGMERRSLSSRGPAEGLHPSFSYLPIPVRHTSTITLPSRCFKGGGWRLLHSLFLYSSSHPLSFTPPLLSGRRVFVVLLLLFVISRICSFFFLISCEYIWVPLLSLPGD